MPPRVVEGFRRVAGDEVAEIARRSYAGESVPDEEWARVFAAFGPHLPDAERRAHTPKNLELNSHGMDLIRQLDIVDQLRRIDAPTLVSVGDLDPVTPVAAAEEIVARLAGRHRPAPRLRGSRPLHVDGQPGALLADDHRVHRQHHWTQPDAGVRDTPGSVPLMEPDLYYGSYLRLDKLLDAQELESTKAGSTVHDEMLFIVVHQAYELWFKQILWEMDEVRRIFGQTIVDDADMGTVVSLLRRITEIQKLLIQQVSVLETMTPLDFLDFRDYLFPASGFQSAQFRLVENKLGLRADDRMKLGGATYTSRFTPDDMRSVAASEQEPSIFDLVERWLERTPFLDHKDFSFWEAFQKAVKERLEADRDVVESNPRLTAEEKTAQLKDFETTMEQYEALFDPAKHAEQQAAGKRRLSHRAFQAALFITLYRDQPALQGAFRLLELLMDIDEGFTTWRYRHAQMVLRMIGRRIGTGGSAGAKYLEKSAERSRIFGDLYNLSTFLIPRADRPPLPAGIVESMRFKYEG